MADSTYSDPDDLWTSPFSLSTAVLHHNDPCHIDGDVAPPLRVTTSFTYTNNPDKLIPIPDRGPKHADQHDFYYSRIAAPANMSFEAALSGVLHGHAVTYSSGLAAFHAALVLLNPRKMSMHREFYFGCHGVVDTVARLSGLQKLSLDCAEEELGNGDLILLETPLSPSGTVFSISDYAEKAHRRGAYLLVSSTLGPPGLQDPFQWGADIVMHSGSKFIGGHNDVICGILAVRNERWLNQLRLGRSLLENVLGNFESWLCLRSLRTLPLRVREQSKTTARLVDWLSTALDDTRVATVALRTVVEGISHTSLQRDSFPWISQQMPNGFCPVFSLMMKNEMMARRLPSALRLFIHATSFGGVQSSIEWRRMSDELCDPRLLRVSIGLEDFVDLQEDLEKAFQSLVE